MRLFCQKFSPLLLVLTIACHDSTAPLTIPAQFELENINGRQLPTSYSTQGLTILSATLTLDNGRAALLVERLQASGGIEFTFTSILSYSIDSDQIKITGLFEPCDPSANCATTTRTGTISDQTLSLIVAAFSIDGSIVYNYRIAATP